MSVQVTLSFTNTEEMLAYFTGRGVVAAATVKVEQPKPEVKKEAAAPKAEKPKAETKPAAEPTPAPEAETTTSTASSVDYPTLQKAVFALANAKGRDAVVNLLKDTFNVGSAKELKAEQYADALAAVQAAEQA